MKLTTRKKHIVILVLMVAAVFLPPLAQVPSQTLHPVPQNIARETPPVATPYVQMFGVSSNSSDFLPFLISPASSKTAWVVAVKSRNGLPPLSEILNFTVGSKPTPVLAQPLTAVPTMILYNMSYGQPRVWFLENDSLAYYSPAARNVTIAATFPNSNPQYMTIDNGGRIWITLLSTNKIVEFDPSHRQPTFNYTAPAAEAELQGIAVGPDGSVWFTEGNGSRIGRLVPCQSASCTTVDYAAPQSAHLIFPIHVTVDHNGTVWFTDHGSNQFGSFNPSSNEWRTYPIGYCLENYNPDCAVGLPNAMSIDESGMLWFSEHYAGRIAEYDPIDGVLTEYTVPATSAPYTWWMQPGPGGLVWFSSIGTGSIGYVNASVPVPISLNATSSIDLAQGTTQSVLASILNPQTLVSLNVSINTVDDPYGSPPLLYGAPSPAQVDPSARTTSATFMVTAATTLPVGNRYVALTAYDSEVAVSVFLRVHVVAGLFLAQTFAPVLGLAFVSVVAIGSSFLYVRRRKLPRDNGSKAPGGPALN